MLKFENQLKSLAFQNTSGLPFDLSARVKNSFLTILKNEKKLSSKKTYVVFIFITKKEIIRLNQKFLSHPYPTDILTFDLSEKKNELVAEIYICSDVVKENAERFGVTQKNEFYRVIIHGLLHLLGYKDKTKPEKEVMRKMEDYYLEKFQRRKSSQKFLIKYL